MIVVDSSVWIDFFRGIVTPQTDRLDDLLANEPIAVGDVILAEVLQGFTREREFEVARRLLTSLTIIDIVGYDVAIEAARHFRRLRGLGVTVRKTIDTLIATRCIVGRHSLLFSDRDFDPFVVYLGMSSAMDDG